MKGLNVGSDTQFHCEAGNDIGQPAERKLHETPNEAVSLISIQQSAEIAATLENLEPDQDVLFVRPVREGATAEKK